MRAVPRYHGGRGGDTGFERSNFTRNRRFIASRRNPYVNVLPGATAIVQIFDAEIGSSFAVYSTVATTSSISFTWVSHHQLRRPVCLLRSDSLCVRIS